MDNGEILKVQKCKCILRIDICAMNELALKIIYTKVLYLALIIPVK